MQKKRTVSRHSFAYPYFPTALNACALRLASESDFDEGASTILTDFTPGSEPPEISLRLRVKLTDLARQAQLPVDRVRLVIVARSDELRRRIVLAEFGPDDIPTTWEGRLPEEVFGITRLYVDLVCVLSEQLDHSYERAWRAGSVFAERTWSVASPRYASLFRVTWESFGAQPGWQPDAVWRVEFPDGERFHEVTSESAVTVALNADLVGLHSILERPGRTPAARAAKAIVLKTIFSEILSTIVYRVVSDFRRFASEEGLQVEDLEDDRLTSRVLGFLQEAKISHDHILSGALPDHSSVAHLVQGSLGLGSEFGADAWERISR